MSVRSTVAAAGLASRCGEGRSRGVFSSPEGRLAGREVSPERAWGRKVSQPCYPKLRHQVSGIRLLSLTGESEGER